MQQRQLRLGDILDDYCPRERRVTNHAVVAMVGDDVKQTRCTTCDAEHEYKHAKVPRQRKKADTPAALASQILAGAPKRVTHDEASANGSGADHDAEPREVLDHEPAVEEERAASADLPHEPEGEEHDEHEPENKDDGPIHRRLIRASLPRPDGQQPPPRPIPEFTIRQPGGRQNRFRPRHGGGQQGRHQGPHGHGGHSNFSGGGNRANGRGDMRSGRPQGMAPRGPRHRGGGPGKRSK
jgi:hypothetical protein